MMELAALILSVIALCISIACIVLMLAKNFFSTHQVQMVPVDPFKENPLGGDIGKNIFDQFREIGDPVDKDELEALELRKRKLK